MERERRRAPPDALGDCRVFEKLAGEDFGFSGFGKERTFVGH